jgi:hypothetical protein
MREDRKQCQHIQIQPVRLAVVDDGVEVRVKCMVGKGQSKRSCSY